MMVHRITSDRCTRKKLRSPERPPIWLRKNGFRFWQAIAFGLGSEEAGVKAGVSVTVGVCWLRIAGGMPPSHVASSARPATGYFLTFAEREDIAIALAKGTGIPAIARQLGRSPSTISREICRNDATRGSALDYRASTAQWHAERAARNPWLSKLAANPTLPILWKRIGLVPVSCRSPLSLCHLGLECERADAAQI
jgi:Helix-turn-helix domain